MRNRPARQTDSRSFFMLAPTPARRHTPAVLFPLRRFMPSMLTAGSSLSTGRGALLGLFALLVTRCAIDDRPVSVATPLFGDPARGSQPSAEPQLSLSRSELDVGAA